MSQSMQTFSASNQDTIPDFHQVLPVPKHNHEKANDVIVITSGHLIARLNILAENK